MRAMLLKPYLAFKLIAENTTPINTTCAQAGENVVPGTTHPTVIGLKDAGQKPAIKANAPATAQTTTINLTIILFSFINTTN